MEHEGPVPTAEGQAVDDDLLPLLDVSLVDALGLDLVLPEDVPWCTPADEPAVGAHAAPEPSRDDVPWTLRLGSAPGPWPAPPPAPPSRWGRAPRGERRRGRHEAVPEQRAEPGAPVAVDPAARAVPVAPVQPDRRRRAHWPTSV